MQIARGEIDYYAALRTEQVSKTLARRRPELTEAIGGEQRPVRERLLVKAKNKKGITRELENIRKDASDTEAVSRRGFEVVCLEKPKASLADARSEAKSLTERRAVEDLIKEIRHLNSELRAFQRRTSTETPNMHDLRRALCKPDRPAQSVEETDRRRGLNEEAGGCMSQEGSARSQAAKARASTALVCVVKK